MPQPPSRTVAKLSLDTRSGNEFVLSDLNDVKKANAEGIVESRLNKWINTLQSQIMRAVQPTYEDVLQASYSNSKKASKPPRLK